MLTFVTCIGDAIKSRMARDTVLLLEQLGCRVSFPEKQGCCGQPAINSGYINEAIPGMKNLISALEENDYPIVSPPVPVRMRLKVIPVIWWTNEWAARAERVAARMFDLTSFIVNTLWWMGARLQGKAVYHPSCSLFRKMGVKEEPLALLHHVQGWSCFRSATRKPAAASAGRFPSKWRKFPAKW